MCWECDVTKMGTYKQVEGFSKVQTMKAQVPEEITVANAKLGK